jgi:hypothetical protein
VHQSDLDQLRDNINNTISSLQNQIARTNMDLNDFKTKEANDILTLNSEIDNVKTQLSQYLKNINVNNVLGSVSYNIASVTVSGAVTYVGGVVDENDIGISSMSTISYAIDTLVKNRGMRFSYDEVGDADYFDENLFN